MDLDDLAQSLGAFNWDSKPLPKEKLVAKKINSTG
jgi:hypothetical protein